MENIKIFSFIFFKSFLNFQTHSIYYVQILILGDMGELGENSGHYHEEIVSKINNSNLDIVYGMGLEIEKAFKKNKGKNLYIFHDKSELIKIIQPLLSMNVIILIKASRFMNFDTIVRDIKELK
jgi:UDP-N-acetylmuramyl pentapeptide synthase